MTRKDKIQLIVIWGLAALLGIALYVFYLMYTNTPANAHQQFDHSQCQYPLRSTNPPDGCDNSDPCDPADAVKGGSGECKPAKDYEPGSQKDPTPPDPDRPYYDGDGNKYDAWGNLIEPAPIENEPQALYNDTYGGK